MVDIDKLLSHISLARDNQMLAVRAALDALLVREQSGIVLADEVGCGKTYEALGITALLWRHFRGTRQPIQRVLVVAERALMSKWRREITSTSGEAGFQQYVSTADWKAFSDMLRHVEEIGKRSDGKGSGVLEGGKHQVPRGRMYLVKPLLLTESNSHDASPIVRWLRQTDWDVVIVDEAHHFTNLKTERSRVFFPEQTAESRREGLSARFTLALTATPFQLEIKEMVNLLRIAGACDEDLDRIEDGLSRYERALGHFHNKRNFLPAHEGRREVVERLNELRLRDASCGQRPGTPGLQPLLRRYLIRNVKDENLRRYALTEKRNGGYVARGFKKLDDMRPVVKESPLIPLEGEDTWVYLHLRDVLVDAQQASKKEKEDSSFVAGDLRQCLSSYEQLGGSSILKKETLPRVAETRAALDRLQATGHVHPKIAALRSVVEGILDREIERVRRQPGATLNKILVFNTLMRTAGALKAALEEVVADQVKPFVEEQVRAAGWAKPSAAQAAVRRALDEERRLTHDELRKKFGRDTLDRTRVLLDASADEAQDDKGDLIDAMFRRASRHCAQPLFLLHLARSMKPSRGARPADADVRTFVRTQVGDRLREKLDEIVRILAGTEQGEASGEDDPVEQARRAWGGIKEVYSAHDYVARFDGEQASAEREARRENFNHPYAPLVLLVSRVGEEGIDLQRHTRYVLHYDVEWNPAKMEQREGRVDREGRTTANEGPVEVHFFLLKDTYEERIFHTVMQRDAWFQVLIGSKRKALLKGPAEEDPEQTAADVDAVEEKGRMTPEEREMVMIDLRPLDPSQRPRRAEPRTIGLRR
ncbi:SNF2-related protein [Polyangium jinanense]|nr:DEAD/DEAH box helicase [Polyangium jinanense]MDC3961072.1 DEAD/DEAH box helicase [Polyangium jinanense]